MAKLILTDTLIRLNLEAKRLHFNRQLDPVLVGCLDQGGIHVVYTAFDHNDTQNLRCSILCKVNDNEDPVEAVLDMTYEEYNKLKSSDDPLIRELIGK